MAVKSGTPYIYEIRNLINNKVYIGKSIYHDRWNKHKSALDLNKHVNKHLQASWIKYGIKNFKHSIIKIVPNEKDLNYFECYYIELYKAYDSKFGYNKTLGGEGARHTEESKIKMSQIQKLKPLPSEKTRKQISTSLIGRWKDESFRKYMLGRLSFSHNIGRKFSKEHREKIAKAASKKVINIKTGETFESISLAAISVNIPLKRLSSYLTGHRKNKTDFRFEEK